MKRSATGLNIRFFSVTIATGHGRTDRSTGKTFTDNCSALKCMMELGKAVMKGPCASKSARRGTEKVTKLGFGITRPRNWNASAKIMLFQVLGGVRIQGSSTSSAR